MKESHLYGRRVPLCPAPASLKGIAALQPKNGRFQCQRCRQWGTDDDVLPHGIPYCRACLTLGRLTAQTRLYTIPEPNRFLPLTTSPLTWEGRLSPQQLRAAQAVKALTQAKRDQLLWAVTGAGKTEIVYPALAMALQRNWRVAWTSPRVDVCLELAPRLAQAFAGLNQALLYGGQPEPYHYRQLTICTTHQLLRFEAAFDWIIVDEVDAFPLVMSPMLQLAVKRAQKPTGCHLYLTATPGRGLQKAVRRKQLAVTYLPLRYHGYLLPVMRVQLIGRWRERLAHQRLPETLLRRLRRYTRHHQRVLLFVPHVSDLGAVQQALRRAGITDSLTVHAGDPQRTEKVQAFRDRRVALLMTTTILERGVTFPDVFVVILGGDDPVFSTAALVQIAGRVGRHQDHPRGDVICYAYSQTRTIQRAQQMIRTLNRRGKRLGGKA